MNTSKLILFFAIVLYFNPFIQAQEVFRPGNVVSTLGDTLQGYIYRPTWEQTPASIWFRKNANEPAQELKPTDIKSFKVANINYVSSEVDLEASSKQLQSLSINPKMKFIRKHVFLKVLCQGPKSLYSYTDANNVDYFFIMQDGIITLLKYKRIYDYANGPANLREIKKYVGQLIYYFKDKPDLEKYINKTLYQQSSLMALFQRYYKHNMSYFQSDSQYSKVRIGINAAFSVDELQFSGVDFPEFTTNFKKPGLNLMPSFFMEVNEPIEKAKWSLYNEMQYIPYRFSSTYVGTLYLYNTQLDLDYLILSSQLRYRHYFEKFSWFANSGFSYGCIIRDVNNMKMESLISSSRNEEMPALSGMNRSSLGVLMGTGIIYKKLSIELRLGFGGGPSNYSNLGSSTLNKSVRLGYYF